MPITFLPKPVDGVLTYSAAQLREILIDVRSCRVVITVDYGNIVDGAFVRNASIANKVYTLDCADWDLLAAAKPNALLGMYDNVKNFAWTTLLSKGFETGTVV